MKTGRLFWGVLLTTLGLLFLSVKFNVIRTDWDFVWNLWPLIFIFWGMLVLIKQPIAKPIISSLFGVFVALFLFGTISSLFFGFGFEFDDDSNHSSYTETISQDMDKNIKYGQLTFSSGAGAFSINGETDKLIEGHSRGWFSDYDLNTNIEDDRAYVDVHLHERDVKFFGRKIRNRIDLALNPDVIWDVELNFGAAHGKFDLSNYKVSNVKVGTGAATVQLKLGDKSDTTEVHIEMGAATFVLSVPKTVGCEVHGDTFLVSKHLPGFTKRNDNTYYSENYSSSAKKAVVYINSGVSSFSINYY